MTNHNKYIKFFKEEKLEEKTFNIKNDVDKLYKMSGFQKIIDAFHKDVFRSFEDENIIDSIMYQDNYIMAETDTSILEDEDCKKAHAINPVPIYLGLFKYSTYGFQTKVDLKADRKSIHATLNNHILKQVFNIRDRVKSVDDIRFLTSAKWFQVLKNDLSENGAKTAIAHELSHWLQDSLHNSYIINMIKKSHELKDSELMLLRQKTIDMTHFELDAQIHAIKDVKGRNESKWDQLTLVDVFNLYPSLDQIAREIYNGEKGRGKEKDQETLNIWLKYLTKRMHREGLLGKNMQHFPNPKELFESTILGV